MVKTDLAINVNGSTMVRTLGWEDSPSYTK
jgi:hypothetical protein